MWIPEYFLRSLISQLLIILHQSGLFLDSCPYLLSVLADRIDSETDIQRLFELVVECFPLLRWHHLKLSIVSLKLRVKLFTLSSYSTIALLLGTIIIGSLLLIALCFLLRHRLGICKCAAWRCPQLRQTLRNEGRNVSAKTGPKFHLLLEYPHHSLGVVLFGLFWRFI